VNVWEHNGTVVIVIRTICISIVGGTNYSEGGAVTAPIVTMEV